MLPLIQGREERKRIKLQILEIIKSAGSGVNASVPADVIAVRLGWCTSQCGLVYQLVREILVDGDFPDLLGVGNEGIFYVVTLEDRRIAASMARERALECKRIAARFTSIRNRI